jgi:Tat protein secretion system quality control protein TatD with DNase activity
MLVDSHCHLDLIDPTLERVDALLAQARRLQRTGVDLKDETDDASAALTGPQAAWLDR